MLLPRFRIMTFSAALVAAGSVSTAWGQCCVPFNPGCCPPIRVTACYQTVPVTEYRECRQTVQRPIVETKYVEQPVTEYKQVVENRTAEVPTCAYQNVTEMRSVQRDCGHWETQCYQRPQITPCQYDSRPDLFGFLNRTGYSLRMAFTPQSWSEKVYVPNVVCQQVPVTRQVAVRGTRTVNYQVCKVVPVCTTRKVAVNTVRMVCEEIVTKRPVTVFKTVPMDGSLALGVPGTAPTTRTALQPTDNSTATTPINPKNASKPATPERTAKKLPSDMEDSEDDAFAPKSQKNGSINAPAKKGNVIPASGIATDDEEFVRAEPRPIGRWVARKKTKSSAADSVVEGPAFPEIAQTGGKRSKK